MSACYSDKKKTGILLITALSFIVWCIGD